MGIKWSYWQHSNQITQCVRISHLKCNVHSTFAMNMGIWANVFLFDFESIACSKSVKILHIKDQWSVLSDNKKSLWFTSAGMSLKSIINRNWTNNGLVGWRTIVLALSHHCALELDCCSNSEKVLFSPKKKAVRYVAFGLF